MCDWSILIIFYFFLFLGCIFLLFKIIEFLILLQPWCSVAKPVLNLGFHITDQAQEAMDGPVDGTKLILRLKPDLLEALMGDPDFLLQHCHASGILSNNEYNNIKDMNMRSRQVRDILDHVIHKDNKHALNFLKLLKTQDMQETFPKLQFLQKLQINKRKTPKHTGMILHSASIHYLLWTPLEFCHYYFYAFNSHYCNSNF